MDQPDRIHLRDHVVTTDIGAFQSERGHPQRLRFDVTVDLRDPVAGADDLVDAVLSYDILVQAVGTALADRRYNLLETLAEHVAAEVLAHPRAARVEVTIQKLDRGPGALGVTISRAAARDGAGAAPRANGASIAVQLRAAPAPAPAGAVVIVPPAPGLPLPPGGDRRRIALLALDQAAWAMAGTLGLEVAESLTEIDHAMRAARPVVWAPTRLAVDAEGAGTDPATLALWLADRLGACRLELALPVDSPPPPLPARAGLEIRRIGI